MSIASSNGKQNITTAATELGTSIGSREMLMVTNPSGSGASIHVGVASDVAADTGHTLAPGDPPMTITNGAVDSLASMAWYAVTTAGTATGVKVQQR